MLHTDGARAYKLRVPGMLHDHVVHMKKRVRVGSAWIWKKPFSPRPSHTKHHMGQKLFTSAALKPLTGFGARSGPQWSARVVLWEATPWKGASDLVNGNIGSKVRTFGSRRVKCCKRWQHPNNRLKHILGSQTPKTMAFGMNSKGKWQIFEVGPTANFLQQHRQMSEFHPPQPRPPHPFPFWI